MTWIMPVLGLLAVTVAGVKWLRVAQREHYLAGSVLAMRRIWMAGRPANLGEAALVLVSLVGWIASPGALWPLLGVAAVAVFPLGLALRGRTSPLVWTARLRRTAAVTAGVHFGGAALVTWMVVTATGRGPASTATMALIVLCYLAPDTALGIARPLERRLSQKYVDQATTSLARLAPLVVGITGSYGKTSTKWYVKHLVEGTRRVVASPASFNNRLGLARAVNDHLTGDADVFVAEMGTYGKGEIADLCSWISPSVAVLTAIGPVHLQRFRTEQRIVEAKSEIVEGASAVVLNVDHHLLAELADALASKAGAPTVWRCGTTAAASDVRVRADGERATILVLGEPIGQVAPADVFPANLSCAVAVALELGVEAGDISERSRTITQTEHRQSVGRSPKGFTIIDDTFNSNPAGAARALKVLATNGGPRARRVVVTPGMIELGPRQPRENTAFGAAAAEVADDLVIVGGVNRRWLARGARQGQAGVTLVADREEAVDWVRARLGPGDVVLYENDLPDHYP